MIRDRYQDKLQANELEFDPAQAAVIEAMQRLSDELIEYEQEMLPGLFRRIVRTVTGTPVPPRGLYVWGGVGRGKTLLMNLLHETLPTRYRTRLHFHHFMLDVHARLAEIQRSSSERRNPLGRLARLYSENCRVLFLDEFIVTNITDAMLLYGLLDALFEQGVVLVATSNRVPEDLYLNGLQRERFLPAIDLIQSRTRVIHLDSGTDHRMALLARDGLYHCPVDERTNAKLMHEFESLAGTDIRLDGQITVNRRRIPYVARGENIIWFRFDALCDAPRATPDYIRLASGFRTVILSDVPVMDESMDDRARRFIYLIDEFYDRRVTLIISAQAVAEELYRGDMLAFPFRRASSRLIEMRSDAYLARTGSPN